MKQLNLKTYQNIINVVPYTYNLFNDDIRDYYDFEDYLNNNYKNLDFTKVDKFYDYLCTIIDDMDYLFVEELENTKELDLYLNNLSYVYCDDIRTKDSEYPFCTHYLFDIKNVKSKQFVKDNIKFNMSDEYREPMIVETDRKYILNTDGSNNMFYKENGKEFLKIVDYWCGYGFVKNNCLQLILYQQDGYIYDYRDIDELYFLKRKDLKVGNKNYDTYDYSMFSNSVDDDKYIKYIYNIVDNADYIFIDRLSYEDECKYKDKLNYIYYDKILLEDKSKDFEVNYIFDIRDKKSKDFIKNNIKFNLSDKNRDPILVDNNKKYIMNEIEKHEYQYMDYFFVKDDYLEVVLHQRDGYIDDYRFTDLVEKELKKYKN